MSQSGFKMKNSLDAVKLRLVLSIAIVAVFAAGVGVFLYGSSWLNSYAEDVQAKVSQADESQNILAQLEATEVALESQSDAVKRAAEVVAESQKYKYQDQIITDLNAYAKRSNISIRSISFNNEASSSSDSKSSSNKESSSSKSDDARPESAPTASAPALKSVSATIDLYSPVNYRNFLIFMSHIEQNLTKMQIQNISLQKSTESSGVSVQALTIEVYTR